jgi:phosphatidylserine/phosphatidylglycerophosphate/cardiolipin synthase-like enzyme
MKARAQRIIVRTSRTARQEIQELVRGVLAAELLSPSPQVWLVSPWIRNFELFDNRSASFSGLSSQWGRRVVHFLDVLVDLTRRGSHLTVVTRPDNENNDFLADFQRKLGPERSSQQLQTRLVRELHTKMLLGDDYLISGSMNFTRNGLENLDESVSFMTDPSEIAAARLTLIQAYGQVP